MILNLNLVVGCTVLLVIPAGCGGLATGLLLRTRDIDKDFLGLVTLVSLVAFVAACLIEAVMGGNDETSLIAYEFIGLIAVMSALIGFLGLGLFIPRASGR